MGGLNFSVEMIKRWLPLRYVLGGAVARLPSCPSGGACCLDTRRELEGLTYPERGARGGRDRLAGARVLP